MTEHLRLLAALEKNMRDVVENAVQEDVIECDTEEADGIAGLGHRSRLTPEVAWSAYATLSEHRFERWVRSQTAEMDKSGWKGIWTGENLPRDLGVVMIWHAYCLNPRCESGAIRNGGFHRDADTTFHVDVTAGWTGYREDTIGRDELKVLGKTGAFPLNAIVSCPARYQHSFSVLEISFRLSQYKCIDPHTLEYRPIPRLPPIRAPAAQELYTSLVDVTCPWCSTETPVRLLTDPSMQDGFSQGEFTAKCAQSGCDLELNHETLKVGKFVKDLRDVVTGKLEYLPGMRLRPSDGLEDGQRPRLFSQLIAKIFIDEFDTDMRLYPKRKDGKGPTRPEKTAVLSSFFGYNKHVEPFMKEELACVAYLYPRTPSIKEIMLAQVVGPESVGTPYDMRFYHDKLNKTLETGQFRTWVAGFRLIGDELPRRLGKMWSAYQTSGMAGLNLAEASKRQSGFIGKMKDMGWLASDKFEGDGKAFLLQKSAARYRESDRQAGFESLG